MNSQEKALARILFQNKIFKFDGNAFETLFTQIMNYVDSDFEQIKPWGNIGDRKNDGCIRNKGIYYQVFAPEDIRKNYTEAVAKIVRDFNGLLEYWNPINEFYFLINDKYYGINPDCENAINKLVLSHKLRNGKILTAADLENLVFSLDDDQITIITGYLPDLTQITNLDYSILTEIVSYIMKLPIDSAIEVIKYPNWDEKIKFNNLSETTKIHLNFASQKLGSLNTYLKNDNFLAGEIQKHLVGLYEELKLKNNDLPHKKIGDYIFWEMVKKCSPKDESHYLSAVITVLSKYFESCDIFEEPKK